MPLPSSDYLRSFDVLQSLLSHILECLGFGCCIRKLNAAQDFYSEGMHPYRHTCPLEGIHDIEGGFGEGPLRILGKCRGSAPQRLSLKNVLWEGYWS